MNNIIHIGANKTGSTTLQRWLFSKSSDLVYLGEDCDRYTEHRDLLDSLVSDDDLHFSWEKTKALFEVTMSKRGNKTFVYSNEDIMTSRVPSQCARRLHKLMPDSRILVVIRNQLTALPSFYINHGAYLKMVPRNYWRRYVSFDDWMEYNIKFNKYSPMESFSYQRILGLYEDLFGRENIKILLFEDFVKNRTPFINQLSSLLNLDPQQVTELLAEKHERPRNTILKMRYDRFRSSFFHHTSISGFLPFGKRIKQILNNYLASGEPANIQVSDHWRKIIVDYYQEDNTKLANDYSLPLAEYGYPIK